MARTTALRFRERPYRKCSRAGSLARDSRSGTRPRNAATAAAALLGLALLSACGDGRREGSPSAPGPYEATRDSLAAHPLPAWFGDAKFGIFVHWGAYSVPAYADLLFSGLDIPGPSYAEWYWFMQMRIRWPSTLAYHRVQFGTDVVYDDFLDRWHAERFDADELVELIRGSGAQYAVLTTKHHDGVALFDSATTDRNTVALGPGRDLVKEWSRAMHSAGLKVGFYYSLYEWFHPLYPSDAAYWGVLPKMNPVNPFTREPVPYRGLLPRTRDYVADHMLPQLYELVDGYDPDLLWFDGGWDRPGSYWRTNEVIAHFYNRATHEGREVAVNDRGGAGAHGDFETPEYEVFGDIRERPWEATRGIGYSFGYNQFETERQYASSDELVDTLVDVVSKNGNFLLNIGPRADGSVIALMQERLHDLGDWLAVNGEAIYGTRPWKQASEGSVRFTTRGNDLYIIALEWPGDELRIEAAVPVQEGAPLVLLGREQEPVAYRFEGGAMVITTPPGGPQAQPSRFAWAFRVRLSDAARARLP
ncbi:MAG: alpha-L-fucosidase [bacterium]